MILLIGAGGKKYYREHVKESLKILNLMPLDRRDIIYLSRLKIFPESAYAELSVKYHLKNLTQEEMDKQILEVIDGLKFGEKKPIIAEYDINEFVY